MSDGQSTPLVRMSGVSKRYRLGRELISALTDVDLQVRAGEMIAIAGPSGSGKSTLLHLAGCLDRPSEGQVNLFGQAVENISDAARARLRNKRIGFVFQSFHLLPRISARDNVKLPLVYQRGSRDHNKRALAALDKVGLAQRSSHRPSELSGGECQRVAIARAIVNSPDLLLCDEPTGNLDQKTGQSIIDIFRELNQNTRVTVMIVTHDMQVAGSCPRRITLSDGRIKN